MYRTDQSYEFNYQAGPDFPGPLPQIPALPIQTLLDKEVRSPLGVSAGMLLNSKWVHCFSRLGFDLLTYKTVRTRKRDCYPPPNWVRVVPAGEQADGLSATRSAIDGVVRADDDSPLLVVEPTIVNDPEATWAVCFGMPSADPAVWRADIARAKQSLLSGQVLSVSVVGTPDPDHPDDLAALANDFALCAGWAKECGADWIEANLSCPNVCSLEGQLYQDPDSSRLVAQTIKDRIRTTPLLVKAGVFTDDSRLTAFLRAVAGSADAVVIANAMQRRVVGADDQPAFPGNPRAGIVGRAVHADSVRSVRSAVLAVNRLGMNVPIFGVGGVLTAQDAVDFFTAGAAAVFCGSGPLANPYLAVEIKRKLGSRE